MTLSDACLLIADCPHTTARDEGVGYPLVRTPNVGFGRLVYEGMHRVSKEVYDARNKRAVPMPGDLIYAREAPAGNVAVIEQGEMVCLGQRTVLLRPNLSIVDPYYLAYYLLLPEHRNELVGQASGATVLHVNLADIRSLKVRFPKIDVQKRIVSVINDYYSAIANARKQIELLEEAAMRLYREWFGNEKGEKLPFNEVCDVLYGKPHKDIADGKIPIFGSGGVMRYGNRAKYSDESVLIPRKGTLDNIMYVDEPFWVVDTMFYTHFKIANMTKITYFQLLNLDMCAMNTGSAVPSMTTSTLSKISLLVPDAKLRRSFDEHVGRMYSLRKILNQQIRTLTEARDRLLPKLMSGKVTV